MVHFDFIVSDEEADTIFDCISRRIEKLKEELKLEEWSSPNNYAGHYTGWYKDHIAFLEKIIEKIKNKKE